MSKNNIHDNSSYFKTNWVVFLKHINSVRNYLITWAHYCQPFATGPLAPYALSFHLEIENIRWYPSAKNSFLGRHTAPAPGKQDKLFNTKALSLSSHCSCNSTEISFVKILLIVVTYLQSQFFYVWFLCILMSLLPVQRGLDHQSKFHNLSEI